MVNRRGVAQPGSAPALGAGSRRFKSSRPDHTQSRRSLPGSSPRCGLDPLPPRPAAHPAIPPRSPLTGPARVGLRLYDLIFRAALPLLRHQPRLADGYGRRRLQPAPPAADLWIQAASAGEAHLAVQLLDSLRPPGPIRALVTTQTRQGLDILSRAINGPLQARKSVRSAAAPFPFDIPTLMTSAVDAVAPRVAVLLETELWPGYLWALSRRRIPTLLVNGRLTDLSLRGYRAWPSVWKALRPDRILAISPADADRFSTLFGPERISVMPNMKFDRLPVTDERPPRSPGFPDDRPVVVLGSVRQAEEPSVGRVIERLRQTRPDATIALFPRHIHRLEAWADRLDRMGIPWTRRSRLTAGDGAAVILWDHFGELAAGYGAATAAFVGGSLAPLGGQNILEPLAAGVIPVTGPSWENFAWVGRGIVTAGLLRIRPDADGVASALLDALERPDDRATVQRRAGDYVNARRGGTDIACRAIAETLADHKVADNP